MAMMMNNIQYYDDKSRGCNVPRGCCSGKRSKATAATTPSPYEGTDADLAKEMNELSVQEREKVLEEIHGVADAVEETPAFLANCILEFDIALSKIPKPKRKTLDKAFFLRPNYANDTKFKLMFLRADYYHPQKAAKRMTKFFDWKLEIFGEALLVKDITIDDLEQEVIDTAILSGCSLQLPHRDQTGRPITMFDVSKFDHGQHPRMLKYTWYLFMAVIQGDDSHSNHDEIAQLKGITNLTYAPQKRMAANKSFAGGMSVVGENLGKAGDMMSSLPVRITSYHFCSDDPGMKFMLGIIRMGIGKEMSLRLRTHFGSDIEMQYSLLTFGIHCADLLTCTTSELHSKYVDNRRRIDRERMEFQKQQEEQSGIVIHPHYHTDVLIGRGRPYHEFEGTRQLIRLIDTQLQRYYKNDTDRFSKTCINMEIVKQIEEWGGRFLQKSSSTKKDSGSTPGWKIINDTLAREKTANLFRYRYTAVGKTAAAAAAAVSTTNIGHSISRTPSPPGEVISDATTFTAITSTTNSTFLVTPPCSRQASVSAGSKRMWGEDGPSSGGFLDSPVKYPSGKKVVQPFRGGRGGNDDNKNFSNSNNDNFIANFVF